MTVKRLESKSRVLQRKIVGTDRTLNIFPVIGIPDIHEGEDLVEAIINNACSHSLNIFDNDIFIFTQKVVSKSEGRLVDLRTIKPSIRAKHISKLTQKDPGLIQLILEESKAILRIRKGLIIVRHKLGFVCANAGIDHSNTISGAEANHHVLLLPENPDRSAKLIQTGIEERTGCKVGVLIIDSHGRAWRNGTVGVTIGIAGVPGIVDMRGKMDLYGYKLRATLIAAADELAAAASLVMGQADESIPCVIARGFPYPLRESNLHELIRSEKNDLFK